MPTPPPAPRARRSTTTARPSRLRLWMVLGFPTLLLLVVGALFGLRLWVYHYLHSDDFRRNLDREASAALHADAHFDALHWEDTEVYSGAFEANGTADAPLARLVAEQIRTRMDLRALWRRAWRVESINLERFDATLAANSSRPAHADDRLADTTLPSAPTDNSRAARSERADLYSSTPPASPKNGFLARLLPDRVEIGVVHVNDFSLAWNTGHPADAGQVQGVQLTARPHTDNLQSWQIDGEDGRLTQAHFPTLRLGGVHLKVDPHEVFITRAEGQPDVGGHVELSGHQALDGDHTLDLTLDFDNLPASAFLPVDWRARLKGQARGRVHVTHSDTMSGGGRATGHLELRDGRLAALPVLNQLAVFTASERYRQAGLQKAQADFDWADGDLLVRDLLVESEGLLKLEGSFKIHGDRIDGTLQVGVARALVRWLPIVGTKVFNLPERDGYLWTTVKLSGPVNHPTEDLTNRLLTATQEEIVEKAKQGTNGVIDTAKSLLDLLH